MCLDPSHPIPLHYMLLVQHKNNDKTRMHEKPREQCCMQSKKVREPTNESSKAHQRPTSIPSDLSRGGAGSHGRRTRLSQETCNTSSGPCPHKGVLRTVLPWLRSLWVILFAIQVRGGGIDGCRFFDQTVIRLSLSREVFLKVFELLGWILIATVSIRDRKARATWTCLV